MRTAFECASLVANHELCRLLKATPEGDDPVVLLQSAARDHIPAHPGLKNPSDGASQAHEKGTNREVPEPERRPSIEEVVNDIQQQGWYREQIAFRRIFEPRQGQFGVCCCSHI